MVAAHLTAMFNFLRKFAAQVGKLAPDSISFGTLVSC